MSDGVPGRGEQVETAVAEVVVGGEAAEGYWKVVYFVERAGGVVGFEDGAGGVAGVTRGEGFFEARTNDQGGAGREVRRVAGVVPVKVALVDVVSLVHW